MNKKRILIIIFFITQIIFSQEKTEIVRVDTIKLNTIKGEKVKYLRKKIEINFEKKEIVKAISKIISEIQEETKTDTTNNQEDSLLKNFEISLKYLESEKIIVLRNPWNIKPRLTLEQVTNTPKYFLAINFRFIACEIIESGNIEVIYRGKKVDRIFKNKKTEVSDFYYMHSNYYNTENKKEVWDCVETMIME